MIRGNLFRSLILQRQTGAIRVSSCMRHLVRDKEEKNYDSFCELFSYKVPAA